MPTIPSTVEIPIGRFVKYVAIFILIGVVIGIVITVVGFKTRSLHNFAGVLFQFFVVDNPVVPLVCVAALSLYVVAKHKFGNRQNQRITTK